MGPKGRRRGRGARERILSASQQLFREQGINRTGMDQLCAAAQVSKRTAYQHFTGKDELVAEYLRGFDPSVLSGVFDRTDLTPRERLLAAFDIPPTTPLCPYIAAAVELHDPQHPASQYARDYKKAVAARLADTAREAGAAFPEQLGEQLALLIDGAAARTRVLNADAFPTAAAIAAVLIDNAIPATAGDDRRREEVSKLTRHSAAGLDALPAWSSCPARFDLRVSHAQPSDWVTPGFLDIRAAGRGGPPVVAGADLGDVPAVGLLELMARPAAGPAVAPTGAAALVERLGMLEV
jgi:AcrR family transcriptional regulator